MMLLSVLRSAVLCILMLTMGCVPSARASMDDPRLVWVEVQLRTPNGPAAEAGIPVTIVPCRGKAWMGSTDTNGFVRVQVTVPPSCSWVSVGIRKSDLVSKGELTQAQNWKRVRILEEQWCVPEDRQIKLMPEQGVVATTIDLVEGVRVKGKVEGSDGSMRDVRVDREGRFALDAIGKPARGWFDSTTVAKSKATFLFISASDIPPTSGTTRIVELDASQTAQNVDLGVMAVDLPALSTQVTFSVTGFHQQPSDEPTGAAVFFAVRDNGEELVVVGFRAQLKAAGLGALSVSVNEKMPEGTWYIIPGEYFNPVVVPAIRRLRAGQAAALDAANIPKIVVAAGQAPSLSFNYWEVFSRVRRITPPTPPLP